MVTNNEAFVEVFWKAFQTLNEVQKEQFVRLLIEEEDILEDILDIELIKKARQEPGENILLDDYLKQRQQAQ